MLVLFMSVEGHRLKAPTSGLAAKASAVRLPQWGRERPERGAPASIMGHLPPTLASPVSPGHRGDTLLPGQRAYGGSPWP